MESPKGMILHIMSVGQDLKTKPDEELPELVPPPEPLLLPEELLDAALLDEELLLEELLDEEPLVEELEDDVSSPPQAVNRRT